MVSFDYMYNNYFSQVCAIVAAITKDDPRDIAQTAFFKLRTINTSPPNEAAAASFVRKVAKNMAIDQLRYRSTRGKYEDHVKSTESEADYSLRNMELTESERIRKEVILFILDEINKLPPVCKKCFQLYYFRGKTSIEIASELNLSKNAIDTQLHIARRKLKMEILFHKKDALQFIRKAP